MSEETRISLLVCGDAGAANRVILSREDLRVRWAMTEPEVASAIRNTRCSVCITREPLAKVAMASASASGRTVKIIVLLEPREWASYREYLVWIDPYVTATSVLPAVSEQLLDALGEATGVRFRSAPRVPFRGDIQFAAGNTRGIWSAVNVSSTGLCIADMPPSSGEITVRFELSGQVFKLNAVVSRISRSGSRRVIGLAFRDVAPADQTRLQEAVRVAESKSASPETDTELDGLADSTIMSFRTSAVTADPVVLARQLIARGTDGHHIDPTTSWVIAACDTLSEIEASAVRTPDAAPAWAHLAVRARLRAFELRARYEESLPSEEDFAEVLDMCRKMADSAADCDEGDLVQVTNLRGEILRVLYDPNVLIPE